MHLVRNSRGLIHPCRLFKSAGIVGPQIDNHEIRLPCAKVMRLTASITLISAARHQAADLPVIPGDSMIYIVIPSAVYPPPALGKYTVFGIQLLGGQIAVTFQGGKEHRYPVLFLFCPKQPLPRGNAVSG